MIVGIVAACLATLVVTYLLGRAYAGSETGVPRPILAVGAVLLGPPLALVGYGLLRDQELEPHRGVSLLLRVLVCGLIYAALWGVYAYLKTALLGGEVEIFHLAFIARLWSPRAAWRPWPAWRWTSAPEHCTTDCTCWSRSCCDA